jgi:hypothetical protein
MTARAKRGRPAKLKSLPERWKSLALAHEQAGALLRQITVARLEAVQQAIDDGERVYHSEIRALGETLVRAIEIERQALNLDYLDSNRAIARVQQLGFLVTRPDGAIEVAAEHIQE